MLNKEVVLAFALSAIAIGAWAQPLTVGVLSVDSPLYSSAVSESVAARLSPEIPCSSSAPRTRR